VGDIVGVLVGTKVGLSVGGAHVQEDFLVGAKVGWNGADVGVSVDSVEQVTWLDQLQLAMLTSNSNPSLQS